MTNLTTPQTSPQKRLIKKQNDQEFKDKIKTPEIDTPLFGISPIAFKIYRIVSVLIVIFIECFSIYCWPSLERFALQIKYYTNWNLIFVFLVFMILLLLPNFGNRYVAQVKIDLLTISVSMQVYLVIFFWVFLHKVAFKSTAIFLFNLLVHGLAALLVFIDFWLNSSCPSCLAWLYSLVFTLVYILYHFILTNIFGVEVYAIDVKIDSFSSFIEYSAFFWLTTISVSILLLTFSGLKFLC